MVKSLRQRLPTAHRLVDGLSAAWRAARGRPLAPDSPFFWVALAVFLWAHQNLYRLLVMAPVYAHVGGADRFSALIGERTAQGVQAWIASYAGMSVFQIGLVALALRFSGLRAEDIGWRRPVGSLGKSIAFGVAVGIASTALAAYLWRPLIHLVEHGGTYPRLPHLAFRSTRPFFPGDPHALVYVLQQPLFFHPGVEELVSRGLIYELLTRRIGRLGGALGSSFLFACDHYLVGDLARFFGVHLGNMGARPLHLWGYLFLNGLLFCWLKDRRRSLSTPIAAHIAGNAFDDVFAVFWR